MREDEKQRGSYIEGKKEERDSETESELEKKRNSVSGGNEPEVF